MAVFKIRFTEDLYFQSKWYFDNHWLQISVYIFGGNCAIVYVVPLHNMGKSNSKFILVKMYFAQSDWFRIQRTDYLVLRDNKIIENKITQKYVRQGSISWKKGISLDIQ